jgi:hypothetical protein
MDYLIIFFPFVVTSMFFFFFFFFFANVTHRDGGAHHGLGSNTVERHAYAQQVRKMAAHESHARSRRTETTKKNNETKTQHTATGDATRRPA